MDQEEDVEVKGQNLGREFSARMVLFHQMVAERFGLSATEHKCLDFLYRQGDMTAGQLAELTGLTTGAITKIVDRLEKANFVKRERSQDDRRQVIIHPVSERVQEMEVIFSSLVNAMAAITSRYSEEERSLIYDYLTQTIDVLKAETIKLKEGMGKVGKDVGKSGKAKVG